jgi:hypothetical protein
MQKSLESISKFPIMKSIIKPITSILDIVKDATESEAIVKAEQLHNQQQMTILELQKHTVEHFSSSNLDENKKIEKNINNTNKNKNKNDR